MQLDPPAPRPRGSLGRRAALGLAWIVAVPAVVVLLVLFSLAGSMNGFWYFAALLAPLIGLTAWLGSRNRRGRWVGAGVAAALVVGLALVLPLVAPPEADRLAHVGDGVLSSADVELVSSDSYGDNLCFDTCTAVVRVYRLPAPATQQTLTDLLESAGWTSGYGDRWHRGKYSLEASVVGPTDVELRLTAG